MPKKEVISGTSNPAVEFNKLFGPALVFKTEDKAIYDAILKGLAQDEKPRTVIERILIRDVADVVYQRLWLRSLGPRLIAHAHKRNMWSYASTVASDAEIRKQSLREKYAKSAQLQPKRDISAAAGAEPESETALKAEIEKIEAETQEKLMALEKAENGPVDEVDSFFRWIGRYEQVQELLAAADKKFTDTLKLLDEYRYGLGQRVRRVTDEIIDVEFEEGPLAGEQQVATAPSSIAPVKAVAPSTKGISPPPVAESAGSPVKISKSPRRAPLKRRRQLHRAGAHRRPRSAPSHLGRAQPNATSSGEAEFDNPAELNQEKSHH
jgi:hypothetical protein